MSRDRLRAAAKQQQQSAYLAAKAQREKAGRVPPTEAKVGDRDPNTGLTQASHPNGGTQSAKLLYNTSQANGTVLKASQAMGEVMRLDAALRTEVRRRKPKTVETGKIKILFSQFVNGARVFSVGGDRAKPKQIFTMPSGATFQSASLSNTGNGINKWVATITWTAGNSRSVAIVTSGVVETFANASVFLEAKGHGFLATEILPNVFRSPPSGLWLGEVTGPFNNRTGSFTLNSLYAPASGTGNLTETRSGSFSTGDGIRNFAASGSFLAKGVGLLQDGYLPELDGTGSVNDTAYEEFRNTVNVGATISDLDETRSVSGTVYLFPEKPKPFSYSYSLDTYTEVFPGPNNNYNNPVSTTRRIMETVDRELWETVVASKGLNSAIVTKRLDRISITAEGETVRFTPRNQGDNFEDVRNVTSTIAYLITKDDETLLTGDPLFDEDVETITLDRYNLVSNQLHGINPDGFNKAKDGKLKVDSYSLMAQSISKASKQVGYKKIAGSADSILTHSYSYHP